MLLVQFVVTTLTAIAMGLLLIGFMWGFKAGLFARGRL